MLKKIKNPKINNLIMTLGFLTAVAAITLLFGYLAEREINSGIQSFVAGSCEANDAKIENHLHNYLYNNLEKYLRASSFSLFYEKKENTSDFFTSIRLSLIDSIKLNDYISNIILYRVGDNAVVSARHNGYSMESLTTNFDHIKSLLTMGNITKPSFYITADKDIAYVYPVLNPNKWQEGSYLGFALLYLSNPDKFFHSGVTDYNPAGTFLILHGSRVSYVEGANTLSDELVLDMVRNSPDKKIRKKKLPSLTYTYYYIPSSRGDLVYLYYEPAVSFAGRLTYNKSYFISYVLSFIIVILTFLLKLILLFKNRQININRKQISAQYADELMKTNHPKGAALVIQKYLSLEKQFPYYSVLIIEPDIIYLSDLSEKQKTFLYEEFREVAKKLFNPLTLPNLISLQLKGYISCIVNYNDSYNFKELTFQLSEDLKKYTKCTFNLFYAGPFTDAEHASDAYKRLIDLMKYSFIYNYSNIFSLEELEKREDNPRAVDLKVIETVTGYLNELNPEHLTGYLNKTLAVIRSSGYSYSQATDFFNLVFSAIKDYFIKKPVNYELSNVPITEQLNRFKNLEECISFIETCVNTYKNGIFSGSTATSKKNIENILQYIDRNIKNVTLSSTAEEFHITPAHLSRLFKDNVGINFSDYVTEKKLIKASELLKDNTDLSIIDIANKLGYNTPSYFSSKFKDRFGVTPGIYKKAVMENK